MTAQIFDFQKIRHESSANNLDLLVDDYSVRVTSKSDHLFWVRVTETDDGDVVVTDFNSGQLPQVTLNIALRKALGQLFAQRPKSLRFKNIISTGGFNRSRSNGPDLNESDMNGPDMNEPDMGGPNMDGPEINALDARVNAILSACKSATQHTNQAIRSFDIVRDGPKTDIVVTLH